jgi:hypothetical protein
VLYGQSGEFLNVRSIQGYHCASKGETRQELELFPPADTALRTEIVVNPRIEKMRRRQGSRL